MNILAIFLLLAGVVIPQPQSIESTDKIVDKSRLAKVVYKDVKGLSEDKEYNINGEFMQNGYEANTLKLGNGVIAMARGDYSSYSYFGSDVVEEGYNSAGSQFFIMHEKSPHLDGSYAAFGKVTEGIEIVNKIAEVATDFRDKPLEPQVMKSVTVDTQGETYTEPEKC